eukprot:170577-Prorocentrum_minimum.AAC.1
MPYAESGSSSNMWYSFNYGLAHFVALNTETDYKGAPEGLRGDSGFIPAGGFGRDGELLAWLEADLAKADAERHLRPWVIVGGHRPLYEWIYLAEDPLVKAVEDLFYKYHVDMYLCGHKHSTRPLLAVAQCGAVCGVNAYRLDSPPGVLRAEQLVTLPDFFGAEELDPPPICCRCPFCCG